MAIKLQKCRGHVGKIRKENSSAIFSTFLLACKMPVPYLLSTFYSTFYDYFDEYLVSAMSRAWGASIFL